MGFESEGFFLFEAFDVSVLELVQVFELGLFTLHLCELFFF